MPQSFEDFAGAWPMRQARSARGEQSLHFLILGQRVEISCAAPSARALLTANFGAMAVAKNDGRAPELRYTVDCTATGFSVAREGHEPITGVGPSDLLYVLEKDLTVEVQRRRPELLFLHSAAVEWEGKAYLFAAESGSGKSTTTWALLCHGFGYLSDELSPIDLDSLVVLAYPHALCLKRAPTVPYELPERAIHLGRTIHVPAESLPGPAGRTPQPIGAVFLLRHRAGRNRPHLRKLGRAEASARLYVTALNLLAHPTHGLDAVMRIAEQAPCFALDSADLPSTCALVRSAISQSAAQQHTALREARTVERLRLR